MTTNSITGARLAAGAVRRRLRLPHRQHLVPRPLPRHRQGDRHPPRLATPAAARRRSRPGSTAPSSAAPPPAAADFTFPAGACASGRRQRRLGAHREHGPRGGLQRDQRQQGGPRADRRLADRRPADVTSPGGCRASAAARTCIDTVRGPLSTGGLYGERAGWSLPGYPDRSLAAGDACRHRHARRACPGTAPT